ncbi:MAG: relaxase/mobilization nuclease domain-containing protein [Planctomycetota bacterium]
MSGLINYLMHDKGRTDTSERVAWTETRNLGTRSPKVAAKVMTATALNQNEIKRRAGVSLAGRPTDGYVMHYTLSWPAERAKDITKEEMMGAAVASLKVLGKGKTKKRSWRQFADEHQAVCVAHVDEKHPHLHIAVQMIHPETGRKLPTSHNQLKLSRWALKLEQEQGQIVCPKRRSNTRRRDRGEYVTAEKNKPRHIFELERDHQDHPSFDRVQSEQKKADDRLARKSEDLTTSQQKRRDDLDARNNAARQKIIEDGRRSVMAAKKKVRDRFADRWDRFYDQVDQAAATFAADEDRLFGRAKNAFKTLNLKGLWDPSRRPRVLQKAFDIVTSSSARIERFKKQQLPRERALWLEQRREEREAVAQAKKAVLQSIREQRRSYLVERQTLGVQHRLENAKLRAEWRQRGIDRKAAWALELEQDKARPRRLMDDIDNTRAMRDRISDKKQRGKGKDTGRGL